MPAAFDFLSRNCYTIVANRFRHPSSLGLFAIAKALSFKTLSDFILFLSLCICHKPNHVENKLYPVHFYRYNLYLLFA